MKFSQKLARRLTTPATMIRRTRDADADLFAISFHGGERFGRRSADRYMVDILEAFAFLERNPRAARLWRGYTVPVRIHPCRSHQIAYTVQPDGILILRILHARQAAAKHLDRV